MLRMTLLDATVVTDHANAAWEGIVPVLHEYIAIPNVSLDFDPQWREHGYMAEAVELIAGWCRERPIAGMTLEVMELPDRTPMIIIEIPATDPSADDNDTVPCRVIIQRHCAAHSNRKEQASREN